MSLDMRMVHSKDVYPYSYYHETHIARKSIPACKSSENIGTLCIMSLMALIQIEMYYIRMYPKHLKVTIRHEKATCYVGGYYNPNPDPKADPLYQVQCKKRGEGWEVNTLPGCLLYTSPSPRDGLLSRMPSSA